MQYFIGMDVGGTYARMKVADNAGKIIGAFEGQGGTISSASFETVQARYNALIRGALNALGLDAKDCAGLCLGASGIDTEALHAQYMRILLEIGFQEQCIRAYNDGEMLLYLVPDRPSIAVIAGTGSIVVGKGMQGQKARYGGWSYLLSDEGSASYIIRKAFEAVIRYWDGYGTCSVLAEVFAGETGLQNQQQAATYFFENVHQKEQISRFAPLVEKAAVQGDKVALGILQASAERLFLGLGVVAEKIGIGDAPFAVIPWGSVMVHNVYLAEALQKLVYERYPNADIISLKGDAVDSALEIAQTIPGAAV